MPGAWFTFCTTCAGTCVEMRELGGDAYEIRNSADPAGPSITYTGHELDEWAAGWAARRKGS